MRNAAALFSKLKEEGYRERRRGEKTMGATTTVHATRARTSEALLTARKIRSMMDETAGAVDALKLPLGLIAAAKRILVSRVGVVDRLKGQRAQEICG